MIEIDKIFQAMRQQAAALDAQRGVNRWGIVQSVDPSRPAVRVLIQPEGVLSGWLPIAQSAAGNGATVVCIPRAGMNALLIPDLGDGGHYIVVGFGHSDLATMPTAPNAIGTGGAPSSAKVPWQEGECGIVQPNGDVLRAVAGGGWYLRGNLSIDGALVVNGDVSDRHGSLDRLRGNYDAHTHNVPAQPGSGVVSSTTNNPDPE